MPEGEYNPKLSSVRRPRRVRQWEWEEFTEELLLLDKKRPRIRRQCGPRRPCPFVGCRYNLFLDVEVNGSIRYAYGVTEPEEMPQYQSCALDVAAMHPDGLTLEEIGAILGVTRERVRQIEAEALAKVEKAGGLKAFKHHRPSEIQEDRADQALFARQRKRASEDRMGTKSKPKKPSNHKPMGTKGAPVAQAAPPAEEAGQAVAGSPPTPPPQAVTRENAPAIVGAIAKSLAASADSNTTFQGPGLVAVIIRTDWLRAIAKRLAEVEVALTAPVPPAEVAPAVESEPTADTDTAA